MKNLLPPIFIRRFNRFVELKHERSTTARKGGEIKCLLTKKVMCV